jgi:NADH:ubiquinone oxidoreductase subunit 5 (subunit L)/multisubunit Na+/H+ antiporter MnhA subunit
MTLPLLGLALLSAVAAVGATALVRLLREVPETLLPASGVTIEHGHTVALTDGGSFSPLVIAVVVLALAPVPWVLLRLLFGATHRRRGPIWATGVAFRPSMQFTATSLAKPIRLFFRRVLLPERQVHIEYHGSSPMPRRVQYTGRVPAVIEERVYFPMRSVAIWSAQRIRAFQNGSVEFYLLYVFVALIALLVVAR